MCVFACWLERVTQRRARAETETRRGCIRCFIAIMAPSGLLLIRVRHKQGQPALLKKRPSQRDIDRGFNSLFIGDSHRAILYREAQIEDTRWGSLTN